MCERYIMNGKEISTFEVIEKLVEQAIKKHEEKEHGKPEDKGLNDEM